MKAEELIIGDWVRLKDDYLSYEESCMKISFLSNSAICALRCKGTNTPIGLENSDENWMCPVFADDIEPIHITKEILEKNSFLKVEMLEYPSHRVGISFLYRDTPEGLRIFVQNACVGGPTCTMIKTCKYVHEVQHMIKMCDIEKTFVL